MKLVPVYNQNELIEEQLFYQLLLYLPLTGLITAGVVSIDELLRTIIRRSDEKLVTEKQQKQIEGTLPLILRILENREELKYCWLEFMSWLDLDGNGKPDYPADGLVAVTVINPLSRTLSAVFRGTPAGAWLDNAKMLIGDPAYCQEFEDQHHHVWHYLSPMQAEAMEYIKSLLQWYGDDWGLLHRHYVTGHSKGGNQAQLAGMIFNDYFDMGITANGPGMSAETIREMEEILEKTAFEAAQNRLFALNASNDYVNGLGVRLVRDERTIWFDEYDLGIPVLASHSILSFFEPDTGKLAPFAAGPGPAAAFVAKVSSVAMELPLDERTAVFMTMMGLAQVFVGKSVPVNPGDEDWIKFIADLDNGMVEALGIITCVLMNTEEGKDFLVYLDEIGVKERVGLFLDGTVKEYQNLPLTERLKVAKGVAGVLIFKVVMLALLAHAITIAELIDGLREMLKTVELLGKAVVSVYRLLMGRLIHGYLQAAEHTGAAE